MADHSARDTGGSVDTRHDAPAVTSRPSSKTRRGPRDNSFIFFMIAAAIVVLLIKTFMHY
jgi:hypothetical protein